MPAIQTCFLTPQITENIKKWPKMISNGGPKIHQKSLKIHSDTLQGPPECICAQLDHQNGLQGPPNGSKMVSWGPKDDIKSYKSNNQVYNKQIYIFIFINWFQPCKLVFYSWESFQSANQQSTGCQRGRRQGRSLKIYWRSFHSMTVWHREQFFKMHQIEGRVLSLQTFHVPNFWEYM